jgi:imidazolonepropionase
MLKPILIRGARQLLTLQGPVPRRGSDMEKLRVIPDGAVLIRDGLIDRVGPSRSVEAFIEARNAEEISAIGRVVLPGFVDCHTHPVAGPVRTLESGLEPPPETYWKTIQQTSQRTLETQSLRLLEDFVRHGTTTIEAKSGFGMTERGELKILRVQAALKRRTSMLASTFTATRWRPSESSTDEYIEWVCSHLLPMIKRRRLAEFADIHCERDLFSVNQVRRYLSVARQLGFIPKIHAGRAENIGAIPEAIRLGAASIDHAVFVSEQDVHYLAESDTIATLLPGPVFFTGTGRYAPARTLIDGGAAVALASNYNPHTSPSHSMQMMIALACRKMGMTVAEAISAATINGAYALRRADRCGSLEKGKVADLMILGISDYREIPYHFGVNLVDMTLRRGQVAYRRSEVRWPPQ